MPHQATAFRPASTVTALTSVALLIHGFHPWSEDGGLYVAGIKRTLYPELYAASAPFVDAHLRYSLFAPAVAALVRLSHLTLPTILLLVYLASIWATLYAVWHLAARCSDSPLAPPAATLLFAVMLTVPVAGTSLLLVDPYVTARSLSFPATLFAILGTLSPNRRGLPLSIAALAFAAVMHPLMAAYALSAILLLFAERSRTITAALTVIAVLIAALLTHFAQPEPPGYLPIALSRYYWFLSRWQWFEILGLAAPLTILAVLSKRSANSAARALTQSLVIAGLTAALVALLFAHVDAPTHLVARLQPLRIFGLVYAVIFVLLGSLLGEHLLRNKPWRWLATTALLGGIFFFVQRQTYPASNHIEWPNLPPANPWEQAFRWIARNTPTDALFALDADYVHAPLEDAQTFRALAERSALPDYSKDGGEAAITPSLTATWTAGQEAQQHLSARTDAERLATLRPLNVTWIVLQHEAKTAFACPYRNAAVQVCRLP